MARANALSAEERSAIARKAAAARWGGDGEVEIAKRSGDIVIGDLKIQCAVLEDGTRVLSESYH